MVSAENECEEIILQLQNNKFGLCDEWVLIHYGWRGTIPAEKWQYNFDDVSNPLRVEGNANYY